MFSSMVFILPVADAVSLAVRCPDIEGGGVFVTGSLIIVGVAVGVLELTGGVGLDAVGLVKGADGGPSRGEGDGLICSGGRVGVVDRFVLFQSVGDGGDFGAGFIDGGFLVHSTHCGEGEAGEDRDDRDGY